MIQFNSTSSSTCHLFTLFLVLLVLINNCQISANKLFDRSNYDYVSSNRNDLSYDTIDDNETPVLVYVPDVQDIIKPHPWSQLFHRYSDRSVYTPAYYSAPTSNMNLRQGEIEHIKYPAHKRAIPIEFQKALFAHGIVGRR